MPRNRCPASPDRWWSPAPPVRACCSRTRMGRGNRRRRDGHQGRDRRGRRAGARGAARRRRSSPRSGSWSRSRSACSGSQRSARPGSPRPAHLHRHRHRPRHRHGHQRRPPCVRTHRRGAIRRSGCPAAPIARPAPPASPSKGRPDRRPPAPEAHSGPFGKTPNPVGPSGDCAVRTARDQRFGQARVRLVQIGKVLVKKAEADSFDLVAGRSAGCHRNRGGARESARWGTT